MDNNLKPVTTLQPFKRLCMTIGELPTSYLESMTYYETLLWLLKYLGDTVIPALNNNGLAVEELQQKYIELKNYVDTYFDNLDIQEEVNNKLDEMAEDGTLENLISQYIELATTYVFDNVENMKAGSNFVNGSYARTSGFYTFNDGGGAYYKIRTITNEDTIDNIHLFAITDDVTLVAELVKTNSINIKQLGAYDNDDTKTSNNTTIIQYALDNYDDVIIPDGTYYTGSLNIKQKTTLSGIEKMKSILMYDGNNNTNLLNTPNEHNDEGHYITIKNLYLDNNSKTNVNGIYVITSYINIENNSIHNFDNGIKIESCNNVVVKNNEILSNTNCGVRATYSTTGHGQINAIWIVENNISWNKYGIMFSGNNVIVERNTIQANTDIAVCVGAIDWANNKTEYTLGSVIKENYTELTGRDNVKPPIVIYSGYDSNRTYNRFIRNLDISNNYFSENDTSIVKVITDADTSPNAKATEIIVENNYMNTTHPVDVNYKNALSYGSIVRNNSPLNTDTLYALPYYVKKESFRKNSPDVLHNDNYITLKSHYNGTNATNKQITILIYPKNITDVSTNNIERIARSTIVKAYVTGLYDYGDAGRYQGEADLIGGNNYQYDGRLFFKSRYTDDPSAPKLSPVTLVRNHPNFDENSYCGYQFTLIQPNNGAFPYEIFVEVMCDPELLQNYYIELLSIDRSVSNGAPSTDASYIGQVCYDTTNKKWYVSTNTTGTWREVNVN